VVQVSVRVPYGTGIFRRELSVALSDEGAVGELIDDFHHFRARVICREGAVLDVAIESIRRPWDTCIEAEALVKRLVGMQLGPSLRAAGRFTPIKQQCTHMFDATALTIARLGRQAGGVLYSIAIPDRIGGRTRATLERDGVTLLDWELSRDEIVGPAPFAGHRIRGSGLADWAESALDPDIAEAAMLLQRACLISTGRRVDTQAFDRAVDLPGGGPGVGACHTFSPGNIERATRSVGSLRDFTHVRGRLADQR
jgi:hypothetical protein